MYLTSTFISALLVHCLVNYIIVCAQVMRMRQRWNPITVTTVCQSGIVMKHIPVPCSSITHQRRQTTALNSYDSIWAVALFAGASGIGISVARLTITWSLKDNRTLNAYQWNSILRLTWQHHQDCLVGYRVAYPNCSSSSYTQRALKLMKTTCSSHRRPQHLCNYMLWLGSNSTRWRRTL